MARVGAKGDVAACNWQGITRSCVAQWREASHQSAIVASTPVLHCFGVPSQGQVHLEMDQLSLRIHWGDCAQHLAIVWRGGREGRTRYGLRCRCNKGGGIDGSIAAGQPNSGCRNRLAGNPGTSSLQLLCGRQCRLCPSGAAEDTNRSRKCSGPKVVRAAVSRRIAPPDDLLTSRKSGCAMKKERTPARGAALSSLP